MLRRKVIMTTYKVKSFEQTFHKMTKEDANKQLYLHKPEQSKEAHM